MTGTWGFGLALKDCNLDEIPLGNDSKSWVYTSSGSILHNGDPKYSNLKIAEEGDIMVIDSIFSLKHGINNDT